MRPLRRPAAFSRVSQLAEQRGVHRAFQWLHLHEPQIMRWQAEMVSIPAPPFGEAARAEWLIERFCEVGLTQVEKDAAGNALGVYPGTGNPATRDPATRNDEATRDSKGSVLLSAHIDTVFPLATPINPVVDGLRLTAPGACDNGAGVVALLAVASALKHGGIVAPCDLLFAGNVGEEGEGDLRGIRHIYQQAREGAGRPISSHLVIDGAGHELVVTAAVGSRRYLATIAGLGGHSWSDAGRPNPIVAMSRSISRLAELELGEDSRWNTGTIEGGTSVNSIPQSATARFDIRSTDPEQLVRLEVELYRAFEDATVAANVGQKAASSQLQLKIEKIGDRPAGRLPPDAAVLETLRAVDRHLGIRTGERVASTDANIPLSLGLQAVSIGAGGEGGGVHTTGEWYDARNRELGLRRILLLALALAEDAV